MGELIIQPFMILRFMYLDPRHGSQGILINVYGKANNTIKLSKRSCMKRSTDPQKSRLYLFFLLLLISSLACHLPGTGWWVDVGSTGVNVDKDGDDLTSDEVYNPDGSLDVCALLPVDEQAIINRGNDTCVAEINYLIGCGECGSKISITRMESEETAEEFAVDGGCGNPEFSARGESPIGSAGYTCTDISGEEYREGVAQAYYLIQFSYQDYLVAISTGYPGQEGFVNELGLKTINNIDRYTIE